MDVLQVEEVEGVLRAVALLHTEVEQALVRHELEVLAHVANRHAGDALAQQVFGELELAGDRLLEHRFDVPAQAFVEERWLLAAYGVHHLERELHVHALVAEDPVRARGEAVHQALGAQEIDVCEGGEEEQALDAAGETDQVQEEAPPVCQRLDALELLDRIDPLETKVGLGLDRGDVVDRGEGALALGDVRNVGVQERQIELDVQRLLVQLAREVHACLGRVDVLVEVEHQVVGHDRIAGGEERDQALDQVPLGRQQTAAQVHQVGGEVDFLHGPGVLDGIPIHVIEDRVAHRAQGQVHARIEDLGVTGERNMLE